MSTTIIKRVGTTVIVDHIWYVYAWNYETYSVGEFLGEVRANQFLEACESGAKLYETYLGQPATADKVFASRKKLHA